MYVSAIVLAAGKGKRLKSRTAKPLIKIGRIPLIIYSLKALDKCSLVEDIIVVVNKTNRLGIVKTIQKFKISKVKNAVLGGVRRQDSVARGLAALNNKTDIVLIHDAARPFIDKEDLSALIKASINYGAAIPGVKVKATVKKGKSNLSTALGTRKVKGKSIVFVSGTVDRRDLWEVQTPQVFNKDILLKAYKKSGNRNVTDDAMLVEKLGLPVRLIEGSSFNIKVTTPQDILIAEAILEKSRKILKL